MNTLPNILRLNAITCVVFGVVFLALPASIGEFLGSAPHIAIQIVGAVLVANAINLFLTSRRKFISAGQVYLFAGGDIIWFVGSLFLLADSTFITTDAGQMATLAVAFIVVAIGLGQLWFLAQDRDSGVNATTGEPEGGLMPRELPRAKAILVSWQGMKGWVKVWLFALNIVFLSVLAFWYDPLAKYTIAAFVACIPLLFAMMIMQRGLTKLLGLGHLVPWLPLLAYLVLRLSGDVAGAQISVTADLTLFGYVALLAVMITICLLFDIYDFWRWVRGDRLRIGSPISVERSGAAEMVSAGSQGQLARSDQSVS